MLNTFITDLKKSPYYNKYILNDDVLCLYVGGSNSAGTWDDNSDFDLIAITLSKGSFDASKEIYLTYKERKVHWYYWSIEDVFKLDSDCVWLAGSIYFRNINPNLIIYLKPDYEDLWNTLMEYRTNISKLACYQLFYIYEKEINNILEAENISAIPPTKAIYHLCLATSYLLNEKYDLELLRDLKTICRKDIKQTSNKPALDIINRGLIYTKEFPIEVSNEIEQLYRLFCEKCETRQCIRIKRI